MTCSGVRPRTRGDSASRLGVWLFEPLAGGVSANGIVVGLTEYQRLLEIRAGRGAIAPQVGNLAELGVGAALDPHARFRRVHRAPQIVLRLLETPQRDACGAALRVPERFLAEH